MNKYLMVIGILFLGFILQGSSSCADKAVQSATNNGTKALVSNETKIPVVFTHFLNNGSSSPITIEGKIDFTNAGMGDLLHISTMTFNTSVSVPIKLNIPVKASFPINLNFPQSVGIAVIVVAISAFLPYILMIVGGFIWFIIWIRRKK